MAILVRPDPQKFPVGSTIAAYSAPGGWQPERPSGPPPGTLVETQTVVAGGIASFAALNYDTEYVGYGSSPDRYWRFEASSATSSSGSGGSGSGQLTGSLNVATPLLTLTSTYGIVAATGRAYFDPLGAVAGEAAFITLDPVDGRPLLIQLGA